MDWLNPQLNFRPTGRFYPLVMAYLCQVHGAIDVLSRGLKPMLDALSEEDFARLLSQQLNDTDRNRLIRVREGGVTGLFGQTLLASVSGQSIELRLPVFAESLVSNYRDTMDRYNRLSAGSLLILAWESVKQRSDRGLIWEFFRHCRNAAAHNGRFTFTPNEPSRPGAWRNLSVDYSSEGKLLFPGPIRAPAEGFMLMPGDVLYLLLDIENSLSG